MQNSGPQGSVLSQGPYLLLLLLEGILRGRQRLGSISVTPLIAMEVVRAWAEAGGLGRLTVGAAPSQPLPLATSGLGTLLLCLGAQEPLLSWSLAWAEHPPRPYFCCWRQLLAHLWGVSRARVEAEPSLGPLSGSFRAHVAPTGEPALGPSSLPPHQRPCFSSSQCIEQGN